MEQQIYQRIETILEWMISIWWYWLPAGIGFLFRIDILKKKIWDTETCVKKVNRCILSVFVLTFLWSYMNSVGLDDNIIAMLIILTLVYIAYGLAENCEDTGGATESLLLIIKSFFITLLAFQTVAGTIIGAIVTGGVAGIAYKYWVVVEKKSDFIEIIFLSIEAIALSIFVAVNNVQGLGILWFVIWEETALFMFNYLMKQLIVNCFEKN